MKKDYVTISIPRELYENVQKSIEGTGFRSVTEFMVFITRQMLMNKSVEEVKDSLRALGYFK